MGTVFFCPRFFHAISKNTLPVETAAAPPSSTSMARCPPSSKSSVSTFGRLLRGCIKSSPNSDIGRFAAWAEYISLACVEDEKWFSMARFITRS
eukprot:5493940-Pyramimonas_sp.AAC.1